MYNKLIENLINIVKEDSIFKPATDEDIENRKDMKISDSVKTAIYSLCGTLLSVSIISAVWLGMENRRIYSRYTEEKALWYQKNRDLEFNLDKFQSETEGVKSKLNEYQSSLAKLKEEKLVSENNLKELADENKRLREKVTRLVRGNDKLKISLEKNQKTESGDIKDESFWSNLLREKATLELQFNSMNRLLEKKDVEIARFEQEKEKLNQIVSDLLDKKADLEKKFQGIKKIVSSLSASLEQGKKEKIVYIEQIEEVTKDKDALRLKLEQARDRKRDIDKKIQELQANVEKEKAEKAKFNQKLGYTNRVLEDEMLEVTKLKQNLETALKNIKKLSYNGGSEAVKLPRIEIKDDSLKGRVVSVNKEQNFVIIDIGRRDGVQVGMEFSIYRENDLIAKLEAIDVREVTSAAKISLGLPNTQIAEADSVILSD